MSPSIPRQCQGCETAQFLQDTYNTAANMESVAMSGEAQAWVDVRAENNPQERARLQAVAEALSKALGKARLQRRIAEGGLNGIQGCPGYTNGKCGSI